MNTEQAKPAEANPGRDDLGRFVMNNKGGPGNPFARQVAALRQALIDSISPDDIQDVATRLLALAKDGNVQAAKLLLAYTIGKPQPAPEPDRLDADEWQGYKETAPMKKEAAAVTSAGEPGFHLNVVRTLRPITTELMRRQAVQIFEGRILLPRPTTKEWGEDRGEGHPEKNVPPLPAPLLRCTEEREGLVAAPPRCAVYGPGNQILLSDFFRQRVL